MTTTPDLLPPLSDEDCAAMDDAADFAVRHKDELREADAAAVASLNSLSAQAQMFAA